MHKSAFAHNYFSIDLLPTPVLNFLTVWESDTRFFTSPFMMEPVPKLTSRALLLAHIRLSTTNFFPWTHKNELYFHTEYSGYWSNCNFDVQLIILAAISTLAQCFRQKSTINQFLDGGTKLTHQINSDGNRYPTNLPFFDFIPKISDGLWETKKY